MSKQKLIKMLTKREQGEGKKEIKGRRKVNGNERETQEMEEQKCKEMI